jgi:hypothetical protein
MNSHSHTTWLQVNNHPVIQHLLTENPGVIRGFHFSNSFNIIIQVEMSMFIEIIG